MRTVSRLADIRPAREVNPATAIGCTAAPAQAYCLVQPAGAKLVCVQGSAYMRSYCATQSCQADLRRSLSFQRTPCGRQVNLSCELLCTARSVLESSLRQSTFVARTACGISHRVNTVCIITCQRRTQSNARHMC